MFGFGTSEKFHNLLQHWLTDFSDDAQQDYNKVQKHPNKGQDKNEASLGHEVVAGGAAFYAMHEFEEHQRKEGKSTETPPQCSGCEQAYLSEADRAYTGKEVDHGFAKEMLAGFAGAEVDRLAETKGEDFVDKERAKHEAKKKSGQLYDQQYGEDENYHPKRRGPNKHLKETFGEERY